MKKTGKFSVIFFSLLILLSILTVTAFAADKKEDAKAPESAEAPVAQAEAEPVNKESEEAPDAEKNEPVTVASGETYYADPGSIVFNNGGTVYNNDAVVYNNGGLVYNNLGTVYNNGGTVYGNGGTVYNNTGTVYDNGAEIFSHDEDASVESDSAEEDDEAKEPLTEDEEKSEDKAAEDTAEKKAEAAEEDKAVKESEEDTDKKPEKSDKESSEESSEDEEAQDGVYKLSFADDYSGWIEFSDADEDAENYYIPEGESLSFRMKPGYILSSYELNSGELKENKDGSLSISRLSGDAELELQILPAAPVFGLEDGTYFDEQELSIEAAENADIYYTLDGSEPDNKSEKYSDPIEIEDGCVVKAIAVEKGLENSESSELKIAIVDIDVPEFKKVKEGYTEPKSKPIDFENDGSVDAEIKLLRISGKNQNAFRISSGAGKTVPAGSSETEFWTVHPIADLKAGEYTAILEVESPNGESTELELKFTVK